MPIAQMEFFVTVRKSAPPEVASQAFSPAAVVRSAMRQLGLATVVAAAAHSLKRAIAV